ncbi:hypothetical protein TGME49_249665 [Toxoplasma gondii ME49]|uniref:Uncharacterized protein n=4 Tax=Toxoplasma gondii TaxID=5811 RepID=A0A125YJF4_TOXGV|nr:hypothetical protein TGME49_249665 [Toxoplasma gondii ME49]EPT25120.1 hypothetical protein TGME49_249665 [Toxoplasma gondii ME49]ESS34396.1 hypothetical protein TGVEG_249665 [Toxoplasma gondii VEG]KYF50051.1 hypothetical protein TGARI_249665 [Toxoplasma gondii ARI]PIM04434.1 hypothetical protein TGCOUG_249665 [Toxoplasma gondii COUG]|eukprot:XP_018635046.1 hypothetical protein TGME49_249665 [Toxoplasma gondii ME49]
MTLVHEVLFPGPADTSETVIQHLVSGFAGEGASPSLPRRGGRIAEDKADVGHQEMCSILDRAEPQRARRHEKKRETNTTCTGRHTCRHTHVAKPGEFAANHGGVSQAGEDRFLRGNKHREF